MYSIYIFMYAIILNNIQNKKLINFHTKVRNNKLLFTKQNVKLII